MKIGKIRVDFWMLVSVIAVICLSLTSINMRFSIDVFGINFRFSTIYSFLILLLVAFADLFRGRSKVSGIAGMYMLWIFVQCLILFLKGNVYLILAFDELLVLTIPFVLCLGLKKFWESEEIILFIMILVADVVALQVYLYTLFYSIIQALLGWGTNRFGDAAVRADTTIGAATVTSIFLFSSVVLCLLLLNKSIPLFWKRIVYISLAMILFAQILLQTRAGLLMSILILLYYMMKVRNYAVKRVIFWGIILGGLYILFFHTEYISNVLSRFFKSDSYTESSDALRMSLLKEGLDEWSDNLLLGVGLGQGALRIKEFMPYADNVGNPHNQYVAIGIEFGLIGLIGLLSCLILFLRSKYIKGGDNLLVIAFLIMMLVSFNTESMFTTELRGTIAIWYLIIALTLEKEKDKKNKRDERRKAVIT